jgi:hypothetical protein
MIIPEDVAGAVGAVEFYVLVFLPSPPIEDPHNFDSLPPEQEGSGGLLRPVPFVADHANLHLLLQQRNR